MPDPSFHKPVAPLRSPLPTPAARTPVRPSGGVPPESGGLASGIRGDAVAVWRRFRGWLEAICVENPLADLAGWLFGFGRDRKAPGPVVEENGAAADPDAHFLERLKQRFQARHARRETRRQDRFLRVAANPEPAASGPAAALLEAQEAIPDEDGAPGAMADADVPDLAELVPQAASLPGIATPLVAALVSGPEEAPAEELPEPLPEPYAFPSLDLLRSAEGAASAVSPEEVAENRKIIQSTLDDFLIDAEVTAAISGPRVTLYEIDPAPGVKVEQISNLAGNLAMELAAESLRVLAPVPGQRFVGLEVPNRTAAVVRLRTLLEDPEWRDSRAQIPLPVGRNIRGESVVLDLARAPHLLVAGATGSGKSVCLNGMLLALLYRFPPESLRLILVDPKVVEFAVYRNLPHLVTPVISDSKQVVPALRWVLFEMERRYRQLAAVGVRNLESFNRRPADRGPACDENGDPIPAQLPFLVVIIDELADIMLTVGEEVEECLARIAQLSRAVGIHTIVATQRPSVNVITGIIKANYPTRIAFQVSSQVDSRTILDGKGAEALLGRGDMLYRAPGGARMERVQAPMVEDLEIEQVAEFVGRQPPRFLVESFKAEEGGKKGGSGGGEAEGGPDEELIRQAVEIICRDRRATTSHIQRRLRIGYNRAALIMEELERRGVVGPQVGAAPREILIEEDAV